MRRRIDKTDIFRHNSTKSKWVVKRLVADVTGRPTCLKVKEALCQLAGQHIPSVAPIQIILGSDNGIVGLVLPEYRQSLRHFLNDACEHGRHKPGPNMHPFFTQNELREVVQGVKDITRALQDLHDLRIFHFDLDESNVMLRHNPGARKNDWILIDFGAARTTDRGSHAAYLSNFGEESPSEAELDSSIVRTRKRFGHDDKRPPETRRKAVQAVAVAKDVSKDIPIIVVDGQAVDMYQWGGTLFNVLFPTCRFSDKRPMRTIFEEAIRATFPGVGVDRMSALLAGHGSSRLWTSTLFRALSPKPDDRYTARDMLDTLEGATEDDLVQGMMFAID
ncbi:hypothetical protein DFJ74DRAFT_45176 [Hyaloraphidium curvatum]|nr:hypothetical protein DFJ74DRAFT_45176 [Hyaloraphidium curvatum]